MNAVIEMVIRKVVVVGLFLVIFHLLRDVNKTSNVKARATKPRPAVQPKVCIKPNDKMFLVFYNPNNAITMDLTCNENVRQL